VRSLGSLYRHAGVPFELIYMDGGMPPAIRFAVRREATRRGFKLVSAGRNATPNRARNVGLAAVRTEFATIVDNDVLFAPNWLGALLACADDTQASVVGPLICIGDLPFQRVHSAGGEASIDGVAGARSFRRLIDRPLTSSLRQTLVREPVALAAEHTDFCLAVAKTGGTIYFEPASTVNQLLPLPFPQDLTSLPFFLARWSKQRNRETLAYLRSKYGIAPDDAGMADYADWLSERRKTWKNAGDVRLEQFVPIALSNGFLCVFVRFHSTRAGVFI
jgi:glycosyltransferase involved in cell wall biosynthesis